MDRSTAVMIHGIETAVPEHSYSQEFAHTFMRGLYEGKPRAQQMIDRIYPASAIEKRHSVIGDYGKDPAEYTFFPKTADLKPEPTTKQRNDLFIPEAQRLALQATRSLLERLSGLREHITHLITVSCTGFSAPGFDFYLVKELPLPPDTHRFHLGFMGCYAAFPAMKLADSICRADPKAKVLIVNAELCSLHLQQKEDVDVIVANALFSDGVSAALVSADPADSAGPSIAFRHFATRTAPESEDDMAWSIGQTGFDMKLSVYVPRIIKRNIASLIDAAMESSGLSREAVDIWALHPGGRAILDKTAATLELDPADLAVSYDVLREYGNMSSATIMFILKRILEGSRSGHIFATAFGPGLTLEAAHMEKEAP
ncbi:MAG: type III polyketide synthase [Spirochaetes bacterium]|jgi:predicted naringenin-chalcone synthase|nr:type III polyketide synthase [Spirochaetota bacterium]